MAQAMIQAPNKTSSKFWNVANFDGVNAELTMYGEICDKQPVDWWTGEALPGEYITPEGFLEDLQTIKNAQNITIKLNSCGGDLYTGLAICHALKELNKNIIIDVVGVAASAGSIIMCAGNTVRVHAGSIIMIHGVAAELRGYWGLDDLKKQVRSFDTSENAIAEIYAEKTGMAVDKLRSMMTKETWMTGREAVEKGFADELLEGEPAQINLVDKCVLMSNGIKLNFEGHNIPNDLIQNRGITSTGGNQKMNQDQELKNFLDRLGSGIQAAFSKLTNSEKTEGEDGGAGEDPKTQNATQPGASKHGQTNTAQQENDIEARIQAAVLADRKRCQEIDALPNNVSAELKNAAKYGEKPCNAGELAMFVLAKADPKNSTALQNMQADSTASEANKVNGASAPSDNLTDEQKKVNEAKQFAKERQERKKNRK